VILKCFQICSLLRGGIAERGGVRVGHRIIEINGQSVVAVPHEKIVSMLATSVGEVSCVHFRPLDCCCQASEQVSFCIANRYLSDLRYPMW